MKRPAKITAHVEWIEDVPSTREDLPVSSRWHVTITGGGRAQERSSLIATRGQVEDHARQLIARRRRVIESNRSFVITDPPHPSAPASSPDFVPTPEQAR